jgi:hypothetical protein
MMFNVQFSHDFRSFLEISKHFLKALAKSYLFVPFPSHLHVRWLRNEDLKTDIRPTDAAVTMDVLGNRHFPTPLPCYSTSRFIYLYVYIYIARGARTSNLQVCFQYCNSGGGGCWRIFLSVSLSQCQQQHACGLGGDAFSCLHCIPIFSLDNGAAGHRQLLTLVVMVAAS